MPRTQKKNRHSYSLWNINLWEYKLRGDWKNTPSCGPRAALTSSFWNMLSEICWIRLSTLQRIFPLHEWTPWGQKSFTNLRQIGLCFPCIATDRQLQTELGQYEICIQSKHSRIILACFYSLRRNKLPSYLWKGNFTVFALTDALCNTALWNIM